MFGAADTVGRKLFNAIAAYGDIFGAKCVYRGIFNKMIKGNPKIIYSLVKKTALSGSAENLLCAKLLKPAKQARQVTSKILFIGVSLINLNLIKKKHCQ